MGTNLEVRKDELPSIKEIFNCILRNIKKDTIEYNFIQGIKQGYELFYSTLNLQDYEEHFMVFNIPAFRTDYKLRLDDTKWEKIIQNMKEQIKIIPLYGGGLYLNGEYKFALIFPKTIHLTEKEGDV